VVIPASSNSPGVGTGEPGNRSHWRDDLASHDTNDVADADDVGQATPVPATAHTTTSSGDDGPLHHIGDDHGVTTATTSRVGDSGSRGGHRGSGGHGADG
jgi:hypothetical protein